MPTYGRNGSSGPATMTERMGGGNKGVAPKAVPHNSKEASQGGGQQEVAAVAKSLYSEAINSTKEKKVGGDPAMTTRQSEMNERRYLTAYTAPGSDLPSYVSVNETASGIEIIVRGSRRDPDDNHPPHALITIPHEGFRSLMADLVRNL